MVAEAVDTAAQAVKSAGDTAKEPIKELQDFLPKRPDIKDEKPTFVKGVDLSTPDGADPSVPAVGSEDGDASSNVELGLPIEFIHFGRVHHDVSDFFLGTEATDDTKPHKSDKNLGGRGLYFRAAQQREAMFLGGVAKSISNAMEEKAAAMSGIGELVTLAADLLGGEGGTATEPSPADMMQFLDKIAVAYNKTNKEDISYADLHDTGIKLHTVRATLLHYLHDLIPEKKEEGEEGEEEKEEDSPLPKGMLENLPFIDTGLPIPDPIGTIITYMHTVTSKIFDVQNMMIYSLVLTMRQPIEQACRDITLDFINDARTPVFPIWSLPQDPLTGPGQFANMQFDDPVSGPLADTPYGAAANSAAAGATNSANSAVNSAASGPMQVIDFLSKPYPAPPGGKYLDAAFQVEEEPGIFGGSEKLAELAVAAFYAGISEDPPEFLKGFIADILGYVFAVDLEFLRGVYRTLCAMPTNETVKQADLVAAGSVHMVEHFIDYVSSKLPLEDMLKGLDMPIPANPLGSVPGINWPTGTLSVEPIIAMAKKMLAEKIGHFMDPITEYAMHGLHAHLNKTRTWAAGGAFTMEAHLADLPYALAFLFRNTFGPLWQFITQTIYGVVGDALHEVLGPAADALGLASEGLAGLDSMITQAQGWAGEASKYAADVESKATAFMGALGGLGTSSGPFGIPTGVTGLDSLQNAAGALGSAAGTNPFSPFVDPFAPTPGELFPKPRVVKGKGIAIEQSEYDKVSPNHKYDEAVEEGENADDPDANKDGDDKSGDSSSNSDSNGSEPSSNGEPN